MHIITLRKSQKLQQVNTKYFDQIIDATKHQDLNRQTFSPIKDEECRTHTHKENDPHE